MFPFHSFCKQFLETHRYEVSFTPCELSSNLIPFKIIRPKKQAESWWIYANQFDRSTVLLDSACQQDFKPGYEMYLKKADDIIGREKWLREGQSPYTRQEIKDTKRYLNEVRRLNRKMMKGSLNHLVLSVESAYQEDGEIRFNVKMWNNQHRNCSQSVMQRRFGRILSIYLQNVIKITEGLNSPDIN